MIVNRLPAVSTVVLRHELIVTLGISDRHAIVVRVLGIGKVLIAVRTAGIGTRSRIRE